MLINSENASCDYLSDESENVSCDYLSDDDLVFYVPFNITLVIWRQWMGDNENCFEVLLPSQPN